MDAQLDRVCRAVGLTHFVKTLPQDDDTVLSERTSLSAGQRQLVTIARAMIEDAPLLILDEATSSADTRTELAVRSFWKSIWTIMRSPCPISKKSRPPTTFCSR